MSRTLLLPLLLLAAAAGCDAGAANQARNAAGADGPSASVGQAATAEDGLPALTGRIVDQANILSARTETEVGSRLADLEARTRDQLVVVTVPGLGEEPIEAYGLRLGNSWGIGRKELDNGVLLIVAPNDRKTRIEVGPGLANLLTDDRAKRIIEETLVPNFREAHYDEGVAAGVAEIINVLESETRRPMPLTTPKAA